MRGRKSRWPIVLALALMLGLGLADATVQADSYDDRRVRTAARLLRSLLAADEAIERKQSVNGDLLVWVVSDRADAQALRTLIVPSAASGKAQVRGLGVAVDIGTALPGAGKPRPALVFLAQPLPPERFRQWLDWCVSEGVILYSPFEGDVERGATAGLSVQAKVQPYVNLQTLKSSGISLRRFYVEHSRVLR